jgi:hypothetical protein
MENNKNDVCMIEAVVTNEQAEKIFQAFCEEPKALDPQKSPKDDSHVSIVAGFASPRKRQYVVGKLEKAFPGMISWR